jgi:hypothetical protein
MPKTNYRQMKNKREQARKERQVEKANRKLARAASPDAPAEGAPSDTTPGATAADGERTS